MAIRVGIIGRNFVVDWMLAAMEQVPELRPAAIYSRNEETGREFAEKYHLDAVFTDLEAFAASDAFDAAYIAARTSATLTRPCACCGTASTCCWKSRAF